MGSHGAINHTGDNGTGSPKVVQCGNSNSKQKMRIIVGLGWGEVRLRLTDA